MLIAISIAMISVSLGERLFGWEKALNVTEPKLSQLKR
jgi:hypothetical protein